MAKPTQQSHLYRITATLINEAAANPGKESVRGLSGGLTLRLVIDATKKRTLTLHRLMAYPSASEAKKVFEHWPAEDLPVPKPQFKRHVEAYGFVLVASWPKPGTEEPKPDDAPTPAAEVTEQLAFL